jgi:hypothetical protein
MLRLTVSHPSTQLQLQTSPLLTYSFLSAEWEDISIVLNAADPTFGENRGWEFGATGGEMSTADRGRTWNFTTLEVPETAIQVTM